MSMPRLSKPYSARKLHKMNAYKIFCVSCQKWKLPSQMYADRQTETGYKLHCRSCYQAIRKEMKIGISFKVCCICGETIQNKHDVDNTYLAPCRNMIACRSCILNRFEEYKAKLKEETRKIELEDEQYDKKHFEETKAQLDAVVEAMHDKAKND